MSIEELEQRLIQLERKVDAMSEVLKITTKLSIDNKVEIERRNNKDETNS